MQTQSATALGQDLSQALSALLVEAQRSLQENPSRAERCLRRAVEMLARLGQPGETTTSPSSGGLAPWRMRRVRELIAAEIAKPLSTADLAAAAGLSAGQFARAFKASLGVSPHRYLMRARIGRAKTLMLTSMDALSDIAFACGLADQSHFSRVFLKLEGETPAAWRRRAMDRQQDLTRDHLS